MTSMTLVVVDTTGIQAYIFGSNRLRENVGASHLVHSATSGWLMENPDEFLPQEHNIADGKRIDGNRGVEDGTLQAELIYAGGGNTVLLFRREEDARQYASRLSRKLLTEAPGLEAVIANQPVDWSSSLAEGMQKAFDRLAIKKAQREPSQPLLGLGVTAACQSTGLVGNYVASEPGSSSGRSVISAEVLAKWNQNSLAKNRLRRELLPDDGQGFDFPDEFDHLGRSEGDHSYIAVVHADGNSMGRTLATITENALNLKGDGNRDHIRRLRVFSDTANTAGSQALQEVISKVQEWCEGKKIEPFTANGTTYLSIRPLVYGGDDVSFVCDGRIGLATAKVFLAAIHEHKILNETGQEEPILAAAGVTIVKTRYPFARAHQLSQQLCRNAKNWSKREKLALDWHLAQSGLFGDLDEIRSREYTIKDGTRDVSLLMRPVTVGEPVSPNDWHRWSNFTGLLETFQKQWPRNKVMTLPEVLREGADAVQAFTANYGRLPEVKGTAETSRKKGQDGLRCVYFDAIEMIEQEVPA